MRRILLAWSFSLTFLFAGCSKERTITLDEGVDNLEAGKYSLIAVDDTMVSFQSGPFSKWQWYASTNTVSEAMERLEQAMVVATNAGYHVFLMDVRVSAMTIAE